MSGNEYLGEFQQVVLLALARLGGDAYGGAIHEEILETTGRDVSIPAVYVTLKRLEKKGVVSAREVEDPDGGRATRNYTLEAEGRQALARSRQMMERMWHGSGIPAEEG